MLKAYLLIIALSEEGGGSLIDINPGLIVWTVITFIILLLILKRTAWKPILTALTQREQTIKESLEKAEKAKEEAQKILEENRASLLKVEEESKKIIEQGRQYAEKLKARMLLESKEQAQKIIEDASAQIEHKKEEAFNELKAKVAEIAINAAEKILKENLDTDSNRKIVDRYIEDIKKN